MAGASQQKRSGSFANLLVRFINFVRAQPPIATVGPDSVVPLVQRLLSLRERGSAVCRTGKYRLGVPGDAIGLDLHVDRPADRIAVTSKVAKLTKQAPCIPLKIIGEIERPTCDHLYPSGIRYCASCAVLIILASFRFKNTALVADLRYDAGAISGMCATDKSNKQPFAREVPRLAFSRMVTGSEFLPKYGG